MTYIGILMGYFRISESEYLTNYLQIEKEKYHGQQTSSA